MTSTYKHEYDGKETQWDVSFRDQEWHGRPIGWFAQTLRGEFLAEGHATRDEAINAAKTKLANTR